MVKIYALIVLKKNNNNLQNKLKHPVILSGCIDGWNTWLSWFYKSHITEFAEFISKILTEQTPTRTRTKISQDQYMCYIYVKNNISVVLICDNEYPSRVAFDCLTKTMNYVDALTYLLINEIEDSAKDYQLNSHFSERVKQLYEQYQEPAQVDKIIKVKQDIDETKLIIHRTIDQVLERGQKLDDLIQQTDMLSDESKKFYEVARKNNSCCNIL